jgi:hypothetical protein
MKAQSTHFLTLTALFIECAYEHNLALSPSVSLPPLLRSLCLHFNPQHISGKNSPRSLLQFRQPQHITKTMATAGESKECFSWEKTGLDKGTFRALTNLVSIHNGGHVNLSVANIAGDEGHMITQMTYPLQGMSDKVVNRKFLDAISELISMHGTAAQVSSAALVDDSEKVTVVVARKDGFDYEDERDIIDLFEQLREYARIGQMYNAVSYGL